jgi:hypothetical protein
MPGLRCEIKVDVGNLIMIVPSERLIATTMATDGSVE